MIGCGQIEPNPKLVEHVEKKVHMAATCLVPKDKLYCKHCNMKSSHNTLACFKKQKEDKKKGEQRRTNQEIKIILKTNPQKEWQKCHGKDIKEICINPSKQAIIYHLSISTIAVLKSK